MLEAAYYPELRPPDYDFWRDIADLVTNTELVEQPRWRLGSGARAAEIARAYGWANPAAAQHLAIDNLANRRPVAEPIASLPPRAQAVAEFHRCLVRDPARALACRGPAR